MYFVSFETSTKIFSLAVSKDEKVLRYRNLKAALVLEDSILPALDKILDSAGIKFSQLDGFAIGLGPGSFTSLRVGLSMVKAFAMATGRPVVGIPTLDIIAHGVQNQTMVVMPDTHSCSSFPPPTETFGGKLQRESITRLNHYNEICVLNDAHRGKVYAALYDVQRSSCRTPIIIRRKSDYLLTSLDDVLGKVHGKTLFVGDALRVYRNSIEEAYQKHAKKNSTCKCLFSDEKWWYPQSKVMAVLAYERFRNKQYDDAASLLPLYLYPQDCQVTPPTMSLKTSMSFPRKRESKIERQNNGR